MSELTVWITEGGCECLQRGDGPVRALPHESEETGFTVRLVAAAPVDALLRQALDALEYHREQTRPIERTDAAIAALRERLGPNVMVRRAEGVAST